MEPLAHQNFIIEQLPLRAKTQPAWAEYVVAHFNDFLLDHAACERKASALAMSFVVKYPDRPALIEPMIALAREELAHFHEVYLLIHKKGLKLAADEKDPYINQLRSFVRHGRHENLLDRLIMCSLVEARGCERFLLLSKFLDDEYLKKFYLRLGREEAGHFKVFLKIAQHYFDHTEVEQRWDEFRDIEADIIGTLPIRAAVH